ncbi:hypothetical protein G3480_25900 [Thiorhodococcus mannitoliphagus]|uniref:Uncharacterized protein n=1 Tax=Thiorhodococcus mannitoliphagus TaxID=329406 RepID=A0A6P1E855_9GAMM|nr:hypothetical protein [Thiorhodococcus mannitoliphagus]NEX23665.1 hypothetical protein [Thiorhodococcus mannitoliphagus]
MNRTSNPSTSPRLCQVAMGLGLIFGSTIASAGIIFDLTDQTNRQSFNAKITISDVTSSPNTVEIVADISNPINNSLTKGDILGLWFDFADFDDLGSGPLFSPIETSPTATDFEYLLSEDKVPSKQPFKAENNAQLNGGGIQTNWDFAVLVGQNGSGGGFNQIVSFQMTLEGLDEDQFLNMSAGMRVQSIEGPGFPGSSKLTGTGYFPQTEAGDSPASTPGSDSGPTPVPTPKTLMLLGIGSLMLGWSQRRKA